MEVKQITAKDAYQIRKEVLSSYQTVKEFEYDLDNDRHTFHLGVFDKDKLVSVASFYREKCRFFEEENQYRIRAMATIEDYRRKGAGRLLLKEGEKLLKQRYARLVWCYVDEAYSDYYTTFGFREYGKVFVVESIGPHKVMYKIL